MRLAQSIGSKEKEGIQLLVNNGRPAKTTCCNGLHHQLVLLATITLSILEERPTLGLPKVSHRIFLRASHRIG